MSILAGIVSDPKHGLLRETSKFRKYAASVTSTATVCGSTDVSLKRISYEVGARHTDLKTALKVSGSDGRIVSVAYDTTAVVSDLFLGLARKFSNFSGTFARANLAGVVQRIAAGLAADSVYDEGCSARKLLAGHHVRIQALSTAVAPVGASQTSVFIPRIVDDILHPDVFSVLVHAVCGEGGVVSTDLVEVNPNSRAPVIDDTDMSAFSPACVDALRLLGANMEASGQGELFALSVLRGLNSVLTVVGHTDEAGVMRDVLRGASVGAPFGAIHSSISEYPGLPALVTSDKVTLAGFCDGILLACAGLTAHCDPGIEYDDEWYPTILYGASSLYAEHHPGTEMPVNPIYGPENKRLLCGSMSKFANNYCPALAKLFGLTAGGTEARTLLMASAAVIPSTSRHLTLPSICPFYWIEPTSLIPHDYLGTRAESEGFGSMCTKASPRTIPGFEEVERIGPSTGMVSNYCVKMRSARTSGYLAHFWGHELDGAALVRPRQMDAEMVIHPGSSVTNLVSERMHLGLGFDEYLWQRGQSPFCAPGEMINLGKYIGLSVVHQSFNDDGRPILKHAPTSDEFPSFEVSISVTAPTGVGFGVLTETSNLARRARTRAARSLAHAAVESRAFGQAASYDMPVCLSAPRPSRVKMDEPAKTSAADKEAEIAARVAALPPKIEAAHDENDRDASVGKPSDIVAIQDVVRPNIGGASRNEETPQVGITRPSGSAATQAPLPTPTGAAPTQRADHI